MAKILVAFDTVSEGFEALTSEHEVIFPPRGRDFTQAEIAERIGDCDVLCSVFDIPVGRDLIDCGHSLKLIANYAVGYNNIDTAYAAEKGIVVTNTPRSVIEPTADLALALLLSCSRRIAEWDRAFRRDRDAIEHGRLSRLGVNLYGKTLGILGYGNIGAAVARRCKAFGMTVLYNKRTRYSEAEERERGITYAEKDEVIRRADVLSLHTPLTPETRHLIGARELAMMKPLDQYGAWSCGGRAGVSGSAQGWADSRRRSRCVRAERRALARAFRAGERLAHAAHWHADVRLARGDGA